MADLYAKCPVCGRVWLAATLPMDLVRVARLATKAECARGCDATPLVAGPKETLSDV